MHAQASRIRVAVVHQDPLAAAGIAAALRASPDVVLVGGMEGRIDDLSTVDVVVAIHRSERFLPAPARPQPSQVVPMPSLTARERQVIELVTEGLPNKLISRRLSIEVGTVKAHLTAAFGKLGVQSRTQAMKFAHDHASFDDRVRDPDQNG